MPVPPPAKPREVFHHFDPDTGIVSFWEHAVFLPGIVREVQAIMPHIRLLSDL